MMIREEITSLTKLRAMNIQNALIDKQNQLLEKLIEEVAKNNELLKERK